MSIFLSCSAKIGLPQYAQIKIYGPSVTLPKKNMFYRALLYIQKPENSDGILVWQAKLT